MCAMLWCEGCVTCCPVCSWSTTGSVLLMLVYTQLLSSHEPHANNTLWVSARCQFFYTISPMHTLQTPSLTTDYTRRTYSHTVSWCFNIAELQAMQDPLFLFIIFSIIRKITFLFFELMYNIHIFDISTIIIFSRNTIW